MKPKITGIIAILALSIGLLSAQNYQDDLYGSVRSKKSEQIKKTNQTDSQEMFVSSVSTNNQAEELTFDYAAAEQELLKQKSVEDLEIVNTFDAALSKRILAYRSDTYVSDEYWDLLDMYVNRLQMKYDTDYYNVIIINDHAWVEPTYITAMFEEGINASNFNSFDNILRRFTFRSSVYEYNNLYNPYGIAISWDRLFYNNRLNPFIFGYSFNWWWPDHPTNYTSGLSWLYHRYGRWHYSSYPWGYYTYLSLGWGHHQDCYHWWSRFHHPSSPMLKGRPIYDGRHAYNGGYGNPRPRYNEPQKNDLIANNNNIVTRQKDDRLSTGITKERKLDISEKGNLLARRPQNNVYRRSTNDRADARNLIGDRSRTNMVVTDLKAMDRIKNVSRNNLTSVSLGNIRRDNLNNASPATRIENNNRNITTRDRTVTNNRIHNNNRVVINADNTNRIVSGKITQNPNRHSESRNIKVVERQNPNRLVNTGTRLRTGEKVSIRDNRGTLNSNRTVTRSNNRSSNFVTRQGNVNNRSSSIRSSSLRTNTRSVASPSRSTSTLSRSSSPTSSRSSISNSSSSSTRSSVSTSTSTRSSESTTRSGGGTTRRR